MLEVVCQGGLCPTRFFLFRLHLDVQLRGGGKPLYYYLISGTEPGCPPGPAGIWRYGEVWRSTATTDFKGAL